MKKIIPAYQNIILIITILVSIGTIITTFSTLSENAFTFFFNSDTLYLPSIYKDIFIDHNTLQGWHLNPSPNIFPDMIVYFIIMAFTNNFIIASFIFAILQYLFFIYLIYKLFKTIEIPEPKIVAALSNILMLLFFMVSLYSNDFGFTFYLVSNSYHTSAFLMALVCLILSIEYLKTNNYRKLIYIAIISILCIISDKLFIVLYCIPLIISMSFYLKSKKTKQILFIVATITLTIIIGIIIFNTLKNSNYLSLGVNRMFEFKSWRDCLNILFSQMYNYIIELNFKSTIIIISLIVFVFSTIISTNKIFSNNKFSLYELYLIFSCIFVIVVFFTPVINGNYTGYDTLRYNIYVFYILIINSSVLVCNYIRKKNNNRIISFSIYLLLFLCTFNIIYQFNTKGIRNFFNYYPKDVELIDKISKTESLNCGLGNYWIAKKTRMFSKNKVKIYTSLDAILIWYHVSNETVIKNSQFNFIISDNEKQDSIINNFFNNKTRIIKSGEIKLFITPEFIINKNTNLIELK